MGTRSVFTPSRLAPMLILHSHEEPMMRSIPVEWGLFGQGAWDYSTNAAFIYNFWVQGVERAKDFEGLYTVGMRGDGDCMCFVFS